MTVQPLPELLYHLAPEQAQRARVRDFQRWLATTRHLDLQTYADLYAWLDELRNELGFAVIRDFAIQRAVDDDGGDAPVLRANLTLASYRALGS